MTNKKIAKLVDGLKWEKENGGWYTARTGNYFFLALYSVGGRLSPWHASVSVSSGRRTTTVNCFPSRRKAVLAVMRALLGG